MPRPPEWPLKPPAPIYPPKTATTSTPAANYEPAVLAMVDDPTNPTVATVYINNTLPPDDGYTIPSSLGVTFMAAPAAWNSTTAYNAGDYASVNAVAYRCVVANTNSQPPNSNWVTPSGVAFWNDPTLLDGGSWVTVDTVNKVIVSISQGESNAPPINPSDLFQFIRHDGAYNEGGNFQNPGPIDTTQLLGMPSALLSSGPNVTVTLGSVTAPNNATVHQSYTVTINDFTSGNNPSWFADLKVYKRAHGDSNLVQVGLLQPQSTVTWHSAADLGVGATNWDIGFSYIDTKKQESAVAWPASLSNINIAAEIGLLPKMPTGATISVSGVSETDVYESGMKTLLSNYVGFAPMLSISFTLGEANTPSATAWGARLVGYIRQNGTTAYQVVEQPVEASSSFSNGSTHTVGFHVTPGYSYDCGVLLADAQGNLTNGGTPVALVTGYAVQKVQKGDPVGPVWGKLHHLPRSTDPTNGTWNTGTNAFEQDVHDPTVVQGSVTGAHNIIPDSDLRWPTMWLQEGSGSVAWGGSSTNVPILGSGFIFYNIKDFGAVAGGPDCSTAIANADAAAAASGGHGCVWFPAGDWYATNLTKSSTTKWMGVDAAVLSGSRIVTTANAALLTITAGCTIENISFIGPLNAAYTSCNLVTVNNCNNQTFRNCSWYGGYNNLTFVDGCFYEVIEGCYMAESCNKGLYTYTTSPVGTDAYASGVDINIFSSQFIAGSTSNVASMWFENVGTITMSGVIANNSGCSTGVLWFQSAAKNFGGVQMSCCTFEIEGSAAGPALHFEGTSTRPFHVIQSDNVYCGGGTTTSQAALELKYVHHSVFTTMQFASAHAAVQFQGTVQNVNFDNSLFLQVGPAFNAVSTATIGNISITNPVDDGGDVFLNIGNVAGSQISGHIDVIGGRIGTNATPVSANAPPSGTRIKVNTSGYNKGYLGNTVPAAGTAYINPYWSDVVVYVSGGTGVNVSINGTSTNLASGSFPIPAGGWINLGNYTVAPSVLWFGVGG